MMSDLGLGIIISLKDAFSRNASRVQSSMQSLDASVEAASENMARNLGFIEKGTMMIAAGLALLAIPTGLVSSTAATQKALGELASVGVKDFRAMEDAAESFTNKWSGTQKAEFITAAYDVKSALASLSDEAVGTFAGMAALTAKATKATTQEMVETFTTGYGIFKPMAREMSDIDWAKMFSGALAQTVATFKTTGPGMAEAIKNVGAIAASANIPLQEQLAILGQLQTTMPGSEAGTLYKAFMLKVAEAGDELGLSFIDASGRLKGIIPILDEVKRKFPDLSQAVAQVQLKKAFGSDEAVRFLLQMSAGMDQLEGNIKSVEQAMKSGTAVTEQMARAMNMDIGSQYGLIRQQLSNLFEILGRTFLPIILPVMHGVSRFILYLHGIARSAPGVTRVVLTLCAVLGVMLVVVGAIISTVGTLGILLPAVKVGFAAIGTTLSGVGSATMASFWPVVAVIAAVVLAVFLLKRAWETNFAGIRDIVLGAWNKVSLAFQGVWALITSLKNGTGQMSADLAKKLQAAGLMGFVTTVFQIYYRVREFLSGLWQAFSSVFGKIRAILEPAARALMGAFAELGKALLSVFAVFGKTTTSIDTSSFKNIGIIIGKVLGVILQVGSFLLKFMIYPLVFVIRVVAMVVKAAIWLGKAITRAFVAVAPYAYKFLLPLRMLIQGLLMVGRVAHTVWQMITGRVSVVNGLKTIGKTILQYLSTPFLWVRDVASAAWNFLRSLFSRAGGFFKSTANSIISAFLNLPVINTLSRIFSTVRAFLSGQLSFRDAGRKILITLAKGIWSAVTYPYEMLKRALGWLRRLLPFSDAEIGPLSTLTASGAAILRTLARGMLSVAMLPAQALSYIFQQMLNAISWVWNRLGSIGSRIVSVLSTAILTGSQMASSAWSAVRNAAATTFSSILTGAKSLVTGAFSSGRSMMTTMASGIRSAVSAPYEAVESALRRLRKLLPFSDAKEGPLSTLTKSGAAMLETFSTGITKASELPARALERTLNHVKPSLLPSVLAGTLALTPVLTGDTPETFAPKASVQKTSVISATSVPRERSKLLASTRGQLSSESGAGLRSQNEDLRPVLEAILARIGSLSDRPIEVSVTTKLDGRQIAQAVYKDMKQQKVKNYETS